MDQEKYNLQPEGWFKGGNRIGLRNIKGFVKVNNKWSVPKSTERQ